MRTQLQVSYLPPWCAVTRCLRSSAAEQAEQQAEVKRMEAAVLADVGGGTGNSGALETLGEDEEEEDSDEEDASSPAAGAGAGAGAGANVDDGPPPLVRLCRGMLTPWYAPDDCAPQEPTGAHGASGASAVR